MYIDFKEYNKSIGNNVFAYAIGWVFLFFGILSSILTLYNCVDLKIKEDEYNKEYVYSNYGNLYYENNNSRIYVKKVYNENNEIINLDLPNENTITMYCFKDNINECIYFENLEYSKNLKLNLFVILFLITFSLFFITKERVKIDKNGKEKVSIKSTYYVYLFLFGVGILMIIVMFYSDINYLIHKDNLSITTATIYSEMYGESNDNSFKPVSYYYVDNVKYVYESSSFLSGNLDSSKGKTFEIYYYKNNPSKAFKKENSFDLKIFIISLLFILFSSPFVFFKNKMEKRMDKKTEKFEKNMEK